MVGVWFNDYILIKMKSKEMEIFYFKRQPPKDYRNPVACHHGRCHSWLGGPEMCKRAG